MKGRKANIRRVLDAADAVEINEGRVAYFRYNETLQRLAEFYGVPFDRTVGVFAALSPNLDYIGNIRSAASVIKGFRDGVDRDRIRVSTYLHCRDRAFGYLEGVEFLATVKGKKIRSFYVNILSPWDCNAVTIDGHAVNIWRRQKQNLKAVVVGGGFNYDNVADDFRSVANDVGLVPNQVQAITWFTWKRLHAIKDPGRQLCLFEDRADDTWRTFQDPEQIETFEPWTEPRKSTLKKA